MKKVHYSLLLVAALVCSIGEPDDPDLPRRVSRPPLKVGVSVQESKLISKVEPVYPELAQRTHIQGRVVPAVTVDEEGNFSTILQE